MLKRAEGLRAASTKVEGSLHVRPVPGPLPRSNWLKPVPNGRTYRGKARHCLAVRVSRSPGCLRLSRGSQVGRQAPAPESPSPPRGASPVRPAERPLRAAHRRPPRPAPVPGAAHLSELPGVPPRPRPLRAPLPCSGSSPVPGGRRVSAPGLQGSQWAWRPEVGAWKVPGAPHKARPGAGCSAAPAVSAPRSAGSSRPGTGNDLSSRSLPPRGAAGAAGGAARCDPRTAGTLAGCSRDWTLPRKEGPASVQPPV